MPSATFAARQSNQHFRTALRTGDARLLEGLLETGEVNLTHRDTEGRHVLEQAMVHRSPNQWDVLQVVRKALETAGELDAQWGVLIDAGCLARHHTPWGKTAVAFMVTLPWDAERIRPTLPPSARPGFLKSVYSHHVACSMNDDVPIEARLALCRHAPSARVFRQQYITHLAYCGDRRDHPLSDISRILDALRTHLPAHYPLLTDKTMHALRHHPHNTPDTLATIEAWHAGDLARISCERLDRRLSKAKPVATALPVVRARL